MYVCMLKGYVCNVYYMFRIGDKTILKELKKANIREKEFIKSIVDQKEDNQLK